MSEQTGLSIGSLADSVHSMARGKGWWDDPPNFAEKLALVHSEISEALEDYRDHKQPERLTFNSLDVNEKPEGCASELADAIIRILDLCVYYDIPIELALVKKIAYNATRPYRHGGKQC